MKLGTAIAVSLPVFLIQCSPSEGPRLEEPQPKSRPDLLWSEDLSDDVVAQMTLVELWQLGVNALNWPTEIPAGTEKSDVHDRLLEAKYHEVGLPVDDY